MSSSGSDSCGRQRKDKANRPRDRCQVIKNASWRVQVKSGCHHHNRYYDLHASCGNAQKTMYTSEDIDIFVAYLVPIDVWYVIPVEKIKKKIMLFFPYGGDRCGHYEQYREAWSLMAPQTSGASFLSTCPQNGRARPGYLDPRFL